MLLRKSKILSLLCSKPSGGFTSHWAWKLESPRRCVRPCLVLPAHTLPWSLALHLLLLPLALPAPAALMLHTTCTSSSQRLCPSFLNKVFPAHSWKLYLLPPPLLYFSLLFRWWYTVCFHWIVVYTVCLPLTATPGKIHEWVGFFPFLPTYHVMDIFPVHSKCSINIC